jgi:hypothetical protein
MVERAHARPGKIQHALKPLSHTAAILSPEIVWAMCAEAPATLRTGSKNVGANSGVTSAP